MNKNLKPFYDRDGITLYCGECSRVMSLFDWQIDLTVTSPPYDDLRDYEGYAFDFNAIAAQLWRVTTSGGVVVWVVADQTQNGSETGTSFRQALGFMDVGFRLHDTMIYYRNTGPLSHNRYEQEFEYMFILTNGRPDCFNGLRRLRKWKENRKMKHIRREKDGTSDMGFSKKTPTVLRGNVWKINVGGGHNTPDKNAYQHPAIFPEKLARDHILSWSNPGDLVLDPMCGSGTTLKMAQQLSRRAIGIEISEEYCHIAVNRLKQPSFWSISETVMCQPEPEQLLFENI